MRILLDECVDRRLAQNILGHEVRTVPEMSWAGRSNGELLELAEQHFDAFVTVDRNLSFQQNLQKFSIVVAILIGPTNRLEDIRPLLPRLLQLLPVAKRGEVTWVGI